MYVCVRACVCVCMGRWVGFWEDTVYNCMGEHDSTQPHTDINLGKMVWRCPLTILLQIQCIVYTVVVTHVHNMVAFGQSCSPSSNIVDSVVKYSLLLYISAYVLLSIAFSVRTGL